MRYIAIIFFLAGALTFAIGLHVLYKDDLNQKQPVSYDDADSDPRPYSEVEHLFFTIAGGVAFVAAGCYFFTRGKLQPLPST